MFDENYTISVRQHIVKVNDFIYLEEFDANIEKIRIIAQSFSGDVKVWFRSLAANSISTPDQPIDLFIARWEVKKNHLQFLVEYENIKINLNELV